MSSVVAPIDASVEIVTPENIAFRYQVAGPFRRLPAFLLDLLIRNALMLAIAVFGMLFGVLVGGLAPAGILISYFLIEWFYGGVLETWMNGQTPGKFVMGIRVLTIDGQPITPIQAVLRNILRFVDMMPLLSLQIFNPEVPVYMIPTFGFCLLSAALSPRFQRLGDIVCGTIVVIEERRWLSGVAKLEDPRVSHLASYIPLDFRISRSLARALAAYVDRRRFFTQARRREVARHLAEPLLERFGFPRDTSYDLLLCALYYRAFIADRVDDTAPPLALPEAASGPSPFRVPAAPPSTVPAAPAVPVEILP
ncbi:MAG: RDD family protein [Pirellulaceae bacterium]